ncbi:complement receptor type 2 isoform X3 [Chrysemys picta bellii]|uniref:complement receptor type 2 isoform X3 n=1 Tax=Chrysemys picta bellii TaxID=8478 RepID=UPI0032B2123B
MVSAPRCPPGVWGLLALLLLLPLPGARGRQCKPLELENGRFHYTVVQVGATANFSCNEGYRLTGPTSAKCMVLGNKVDWDKEVPLCEGQCGTLPTLSRAIPRDTSRTEGFPIGTEVTYRCLDGFVKIPGKSDTVVCLSDSKWSTIGEFCNGACGATPRLKSAALSAEDAKKNYCPPGTTVSYVCRPGYESTELKPVITCLKNSTWSEAPEFCKGKSCGVPKGPEHGRAVDITNDRYGARVNIICDDGFRLRGRPFIQCLLKGDQVEWSQLPTCEGICDSPPRLSFAELPGPVNNSYPVGAKLKYSCRPGYVLNPGKSPYVTCLPNSTWSVDPEFCVGTCDSPPRLSFAELPGAVNNSYPVGTKLKYFCRPGYMLGSGKSPVVTCLANSTWSVDPEFCVGICGSPPRLSFAELSGPVNNSYPVGTKLKYSCRPGYMLGSGKSPYVTCLANSTWSVDPEFCVGRPCKPLELQNGRVDLTDLLFGATANFSCNEGYRLTGTTSAQCVVVGNGVDWDKELPLCHAIPCLPPPDVTNGSHTGQSEQEFPYGSAVTYKCDQGFSLIGEASIHCTTKDNVNGEWSGPAPECKVVKCPEPEVKNGKKQSGFGPDYSYGNTVIFECDSGYTMIGSSSVRCEANNSWVPSLPTCLRICGSPPRLSFAELSGPVNNSYPVGTKLKYSCRPGYMLGSGKSPYVTCLENSTWSVDPEFCVGRPCKQLELENGRVHFTDLRFGATANFSCNEGYRLIGTTSAKCVVVENGVDWDKELPHCEAIPCHPPPPITNGSHNGQSEQQFFYGSAVTYKCDRGFSLIGEATIHCTTKDNVDGEWSGPAPECKVVKCPEPEVKNGKKQSGFGPDYSYGNTVIFECDSGYTLKGSSLVKCEANNSWVPSLPTCLSITHTTPTTPTTPTTSPPGGTEDTSGPNTGTMIAIGVVIGLLVAGGIVAIVTYKACFGGKGPYDANQRFSDLQEREKKTNLGLERKDAYHSGSADY